MYRLAIVFVITLFGSYTSNAQGVQHIDAKTFSELINSGEGVILDVRTKGEYSKGHIKNATLISSSDRKFIEKVSLLQKNKPLYIYCLTGSRSNAVANYLSQNGYTKIYNLSRGIMQWQQYGFPLEQSSQPITNNSKTYGLADFNQLLATNKIVLIDFHAPWCAPCKQMSPIIEKAQVQYKTKAKIEKIDIQANATLKNTYKIESIPELILFKNGKEVWKHTGLISYEALSKVLNQHL